MKNFKLIIKWLFCLLFILIGCSNVLGNLVDLFLMIEDLSFGETLKISSIGFIIVGFIISPLFDKFTKKINKNYSGLRKFVLSFGIIMISIICSLLFGNICSKNVLGFIWSIILTLLFISLYFYIVYITNKKKYEDKVKNKWYIVLLVVILLLNIPYFIAKGLIIKNYNNMIETYSIQYLDTKKIETIEIEEKDYYTFKNLKIKNNFKDYEVTYEQEDPYKSITLIDRDNNKIKGIALTNFDYYRDFYNEVLEISKKNILSKIHPYSRFILSNNINSEQNYYKYLKENQKLSIFDNIGEIYTSWLFANISLASIKDFQLIEHNKYNISIMTGHTSDKGSVKIIEVIDDEKIYTITLFTTNNFTNEELYTFISTIKLS